MSRRTNNPTGRPRQPCSQNRWWRRGCACAHCFEKRRRWGKARGDYNRRYRQRPEAKARDAARQKARPNRADYQRDWKRRRAREDRARWRCECDALNIGRGPCACGRPRTWQAA